MDGCSHLESQPPSSSLFEPLPRSSAVTSSDQAAAPFSKASLPNTQLPEYQSTKHVLTNVEQRLISEVGSHAIIAEHYSTKAKKKQKSPLKFPKNKGSRRNIYPDQTENRLQRWKRMVDEYECTDGLKYHNKYKFDTPGFHKSRTLPTQDKFTKMPYEVCTSKIRSNNTILDTGEDSGYESENDNDDLVNSVFPLIHDSKAPVLNRVSCSEETLHQTQFCSTSVSDLQDWECCVPSHFQFNSNRLNHTLLPHLKATILSKQTDLKSEAFLLIDTGSTHSLMSKTYLQKYFPMLKVDTLQIDFSHAGQTTKKGVVGKILLALEFVDVANQKLTVWDTFYIVEHMPTIDLILGNTILNSTPHSITQHNVSFTPANGDYTYVIPIERRDTKNQQLSRKVSLYESQVIPPHRRLQVQATCSNLSATEAKSLFGKTILVTPDEDHLSSNQQQLGVSCIDTLSKLKIDEFSKPIFQTMVENNTSDPVYVQSNFTLGTLDFYDDDKEEIDMCDSDYFSLNQLANIFIENFNDDELREILQSKQTPFQSSVHATDTSHENIPYKHNSEKYPQTDNNSSSSTYVQANHAASSAPLTVLTDESNVTREFAYSPKMKYPLGPEDAILDNIPMTEIRIDLPNQQPDLTEDQFLQQFDLDHLSPEVREKFHKIFLRMRTAFAQDKTDIGRSPLMEMKIETPPGLYAKQKERQIDMQKLKFLYPIIQHYLDKGIIRLVDSNFASNLVLIQKPLRSSPDDVQGHKLQDKQALASLYRLTQDLRDVNAMSKKIIFPLGSPESIIQNTKGKICSLIDLNAAYYHLGLRKEDQHKTAFYLGNKLYCWTVATQGLANAPQYFSMLMCKIFSKEMNIKLQQKYGKTLWPQRYLDQGWEEIVSFYLDDIVIHSQDIDTHADDVFRVTAALLEADMKISSPKSSWAQTKFILLGIQVDTAEDRITMSDLKAQGILALPKPATLSDIQCQLAIFSYWQRFLPRWREIAIPLSRMLKTKQFQWGEYEEQAYQDLRELIRLRLALSIPDPTKHLFLFCDASYFACSSWIAQIGSDNKSLNICGVASKLFSHTELRNPIYHKEALSMIYAVQHWTVYIHANQVHLTIFTDASGLSYFFRQKQFNSKFSLASNYLSTFLASPGLTIQCISGHHNILADSISRAFHTLAEDELTEYYTLSRKRALALPPIPEYGTLSSSAVWKILMTNPKPEATDLDNRHKRPCRNPLTIFDEVQLFLDKTAEEKYIDFQEFTKGHGNVDPVGDYVDTSTEHLLPVAAMVPNESPSIQVNFADKKVDFSPHCQYSSDQPDVDEIFDLLLKVQYCRTFLMNFLNFLDTFDYNQSMANFQGIDVPMLTVKICLWLHSKDIFQSPDLLEAYTTFVFEVFSLLTDEGKNKLTAGIPQDRLMVSNKIFFRDIQATWVQNKNLFNLAKASFNILKHKFHSLTPHKTVGSVGVKQDRYLQLGRKVQKMWHPQGNTITICPTSDITSIPLIHYSYGSVAFQVDTPLQLAPYQQTTLNLNYNIQCPYHLNKKFTTTSRQILAYHHNNLWSSNLQGELITLYNCSSDIVTLHPHTNPPFLIRCDFSIGKNVSPPLVNFNLILPTHTNIWRHISVLKPQLQIYHSLLSHQQGQCSLVHTDLDDPLTISHQLQAVTSSIPSKPQPSSCTTTLLPSEAEALAYLLNTVYPPEIWEELNTPVGAERVRAHMMTLLPEESPELQGLPSSFVTTPEEEQDQQTDEQLNGEALEDTEASDFQDEWTKTYLDNLTSPLDVQDPETLAELTPAQQDAIFYFHAIKNKTISKEQFIAEQEKDRFCHTKRQQYENLKSAQSQLQANFFICKNVLCYQERRNDPTSPIRPCVPMLLMKHLVTCLHQSHLHISAKRTTHLFNRFFYHPKPKQWIKSYLKNCLMCKLEQNRPPLPPIGEERSMKPTRPREAIYVDFAINVAPPTALYRHVMVVVDAFTSFINLIPLINKEGPTVLEAFQKQYLQQFGIPNQFYSDQDDSFLGEVRTYLLQRNTILRASFPYSQHQNSLAEGGVKALKVRLRALLNDPEFALYNNVTEWHKMLPDIQTIINSSPMANSAYSRELLMFGYNLATNIPFSFTANRDNQWKDLTEYVEQGFALQKSAQAQVTETKDKRRRQQAEKGNPLSLNQNMFLRGQLVLQSRDKKTLANFDPKKRVCRVLHATPRGLTLLDLSTNKIISSNLQNITPLTCKTMELYYPKAFFKNLELLCQDVNRRPHPRGSLLLTRPPPKPPDPIPPHPEGRPQRQTHLPAKYAEYDMSTSDDASARLRHFS